MYDEKSSQRRWRCGRGLLIASAILGFGIAFVVGKQLGLDRSDPTNRARFHAIPIAISQIYHGAPHDYTGYQSVAFPFQGTAPLDTLISAAIRAKLPPNDPIYFWTADDRGFSDFVNIAFRLFGARVTSLYYFWFVLLGISLAVALIRFHHDPISLACIASLMLAVAEFLPAYVRALGGDFTEISIHVSESRFFDVLGAVAVLHIVLSVLRPVSRSRAQEILALTVQICILAFLLHARGSLSWIFVTLIGIAGLSAGIRALRPGGRVAIVHAAAPAIGLIVTWLLVVAYQSIMYHPAYRAQRGERTVWHNVLMGLSLNRTFAKALRLSRPKDGPAIDAVLRDMKERSDPRLSHGWERQKILNSLGSHNEFDWPAYEDAARDLVMRQVIRHPGAALRMVLWDKPKNAMGVIFCQAMLVERFCPLMTNSPARPFIRPDVRFQPASMVSFACLLLAAVGLYLANDGGDSAGAVIRPLTQITAIGFVIAVVGTLPSLVFYPGVTQLGGTIVFGTLVFYLLAVIAFTRVADAIAARSSADVNTVSRLLRRIKPST